MAQFDEYIEARDVKWTPELEVALFHSMHGHKPVGEYKKTRDSLAGQTINQSNARDGSIPCIDSSYANNLL